MGETKEVLIDDTPEGAPIHRGGRRAVDIEAVRHSHEYKVLKQSYRLECEHKRNADGSKGAPCWLCGEDIDYRLRAPHPFSWSMDHVTPAAEAPWLMLDRNNVAPAHLDCNVRRGTSEPALHLGVPSEIW